MPKARDRMPDQEPPKQSAEGAGGAAGTAAAPSARPPSEGEGAASVAAGAARPDRFDPSGAALVGAGGAGAAMTAPPSGEGAGAGDAGATTWLGDKRVSSLWSINQTRNSWVGIAGVGWLKLSNASDSAIVAMTMLASHARQMQTRFDYRQEADGMIHETYVW